MRVLSLVMDDETSPGLQGFIKRFKFFVSNIVAKVRTGSVSDRVTINLLDCQHLPRRSRSVF
jgi:hypothetical protein